MGNRVVPYLLMHLGNENFAHWRPERAQRFRDAANKLLRLVTGRSFGEMERHEATSYEPDDPMRQDARRRTLGSIERVRQRWLEWWAARKKE